MKCFITCEEWFPHFEAHDADPPGRSASEVELGREEWEAYLGVCAQYHQWQLRLGDADESYWQDRKVIPVRLRVRWDTKTQKYVREAVDAAKAFERKPGSSV